MVEINDHHNKIEKLRKDIDNIDDRIAELLNKRGEIAFEIGKIKKEHNLKIKQPKRENELIERIGLKSTVYMKKNIQAIWKEIINASRELQDSIAKNSKNYYSELKRKKTTKN
ncbi:MAG: chorismate mutase [Candidatus Heimdallarchaeota archaeon]